MMSFQSPLCQDYTALFLSSATTGMVMAVVPEDGVENCLAVARSLYQTAETTVKHKLLLDDDVHALNEVK